MTKHIIMVSGVMLFFFFALSLGFCAEEITITTYYPSPYGSYNKLTTNTLGIGDVDIDGSLDDDDAPDPSTDSGDLWVAGRIELGRETPFNICIGEATCSAITSGGWNIFIGSNAGLVNTTGQQNVFIGPAAGGSTTTANYNTFIGMNAGQSNTSGSNNAFLGRYAGYYNTTGSSNTFLGYEAGQNSTTGGSHTFVGSEAGKANTTGNRNTFVGGSAGTANTTGNYNTFLGAWAGLSNTTGSFNTFLGADYVGYSNTTGSYNTFVGAYYTGRLNTGGNYNTLLGYYAGAGNTTGSNNTYVGTAAGGGNITGGYNVCLGAYAGYNETGSNKLHITNTNDATPLIYGDFAADTVTINGQLSASTCGGCVSDKKFKKDVNTIESPIEKILKMRGVSFNWNEKYKGRGFPEGRHFGLIAQEVKEVLPEVVSYNSYKENTIVYTEIIPVLIEAIKEQQREIEILKKKLERKKL